jgi:hypothetical protein
MYCSRSLERLLERLSVQDCDLEHPAISAIKDQLADLRNLGLQLDSLELKNRLLHEINQELHKSLQNCHIQRGSPRNPIKRSESISLKP